MRAQKAAELLEAAAPDLESVSRLDYTFDQLKLVGAVVGLKKLLETVVDPETDEKTRVSAAKVLVDIKEDPERIIERLRAAPYVEVTVEELEHMIKTGEFDTPETLQLTEGDTNGES
jgi:hypothetical protein